MSENGPDLFEFTGGLFNLIGGAFNFLKGLIVPLLVVGGGLLAFKMFSDSSRNGNAANKDDNPATPATDMKSRSSSPESFFSPASTPAVTTAPTPQKNSGKTRE
jgi:hypothetical protein